MTSDARLCVFENSREWLAKGFTLSPLELPLTSGIVFSEPNKFDRNFAVFEDSMPDGYGLYLIDRMLRKSGFQLKNLKSLSLNVIQFIYTHTSPDSVKIDCRFVSESAHPRRADDGKLLKRSEIPELEA